MAISSKIEEIIFEITKTAGNIYDALKLGIGNANTPKSSIFELNNLLSVAQNGIPYFGVIETNPLGFGITYDFTLDQYHLIVKSGQIGYNNSIIQIPQQKIPINKEFIKDGGNICLQTQNPLSTNKSCATDKLESIIIGHSFAFESCSEVLLF